MEWCLVVRQWGRHTPPAAAESRDGVCYLLCRAAHYPTLGVAHPAEVCLLSHSSCFCITSIPQTWRAVRPAYSYSYTNTALLSLPTVEMVLLTPPSLSPAVGGTCRCWGACGRRGSEGRVRGWRLYILQSYSKSTIVCCPWFFSNTPPCVVSRAQRRTEPAGARTEFRLALHEMDTFLTHIQTL